MYKRIVYFFVLISIVLTSCETDFDPNAEYKDITVVYGILNQNDSITYIKINKAFLGKTSAYIMAQNEDSSSYGANLEVKMEEWNNGTYVKTFYFDTTSIYNKEPGIFYAPHQILYYCVTYNQLNQGSDYKLIIKNKKTGKLITATSQIVNKFSIDTPDKNALFIDFSTNGKKKITWRSAKYGKRYQTKIRFNYLENGIPKFLDIIFPMQKSSNTAGGLVMNDEYTSATFYQALQSNLTPSTSTNPIVRVAGKVEVIITVAADELSTYIDVNAPSNTIVQVRPEYTNIVNGIGIFSARYDNSIFNSRILDLNSRSIDSLKFGQYTNMLGF